ncbi:MAG TPA: acyl carrier protein [Stellaceae bacterium]|jgi:acyl carrier protein
MTSRVTRIVAEVLGIAAVEITDDTSPDNTSQWDSMTAVNLVAAIEDEFDIRLSTAEIVSLRSVATVKEVLSAKGIADA